MASYIEYYFQQLPSDVKNLLEAIVVKNILDEKGYYDYHAFVDRISNKNKQTINETKAKVPEIRDFRVLNLEVSNFRKFSSKNGCSYSLDFTDDVGNPCSLFLVGSNGSGKSSLFSALEYIITGEKIGAMIQRGITDEKNYLPYGKVQMNKVKVELKIADKNQEVKIGKPISCDYSRRPFFCSDWDLQEIQSSYSLLKIFEDNLGLSELINIIRDIRESIIIFRHKRTIPVANRPKTYNSNILQQDLLYIGSIENLSKVKKIKYKIDTEILELGKIKVSDKSINEKQIEYFTRVDLLTSDDLKSLEYYKENDRRIKRIKKKIELMSDLDSATIISNNDVLDFDDLIEENIEYLTKLQSAFKWKPFKAQDHRRSAINAVRQSMDSEENNIKNEILKRNQDSLTVEEIHIENLEKLCQTLDNVYENCFNEIVKACHNVVEPLLQTFTELSDYQQKGEVLKIVFNNRDIRAIITNKEVFEEGKEFTPAEFYNSFRYKLYCISVKVSLAFMTMKTCNIIAPLVFDDVFTASDFDNTVNINRFFELILKSFVNLGLGSEQDLQIIMFTHDEIVLNSMTRTMCKIGNGKFHFITGSLLDIEALNDKTDRKNNVYQLYDRIN